jgi:hypothetical protein
MTEVMVANIVMMRIHQYSAGASSNDACKEWSDDGIFDARSEF